MHTTRRSLLYTLGALQASHTSRALAHAARFIEPARSHLPNNPIYVLFEGPWLISHTKDQDGITAMTVDDDHHLCTAGRWNTESMTIDPSSPLLSGQTWTIHGANVAKAASFAEIFQESCSNHKLAWIRRAPHTLQPTGTERCVKLPMPTRAYVAGFLPETHISNTSDPVLDASPVSPHVTTILEYSASGGVGALQLQRPGGPAQTYAPGDHLIFRMLVPNPTCPDIQHVEDAFNFLAARVKVKTVSPVKISCTSTRYQTGTCAPEFQDKELGLEHDTCNGRAKAQISAPGSIHVLSHFANCAGATLLAGE